MIDSVTRSDHITAVMWLKSKPEVEFQYAGRLGEFKSMSSRSHLPHRRVLWLLSSSEFYGMLSQSVSRVKLQGVQTRELNVMIPVPRATLQGVRIPSAILKIVIRHILRINAVHLFVRTQKRDFSQKLSKLQLLTTYRKGFSKNPLFYF